VLQVLSNPVNRLDEGAGSEVQIQADMKGAAVLTLPTDPSLLRNGKLRAILSSFFWLYDYHRIRLHGYVSDLHAEDILVEPLNE
jgi:hypothetical protein